MHTESRTEALERLQSEAGQTPPEDCTPSSLPIGKIKTEQLVFQPRDIGSDAHVDALVSAIKAKGGKPLDPLMVWYSGKDWYVIDGHHRLLAYREFNQANQEKKINKIPIAVFEGTLPQAICKAAAANSKDKLSMSARDKSNVAWRLVCMEDKSLSAKRIGGVAGVSRRTVQSMRRCLATLKEKSIDGSPIDLSWYQARLMEKGEEQPEWNPDRNEQQGREWADRMKRQFGGAFASNPEAAAYAIIHYSPDLPRRLLETEAFQDAAEDYAINRMKEEGYDDVDIYY